MAVVLLVSFLTWAAQAGPPDQAGLYQTATAYWQSLARQDKAAALKYVLTECLNNFIARKEPQIKAWEIVGADVVSPGRAVVTVELSGALQGSNSFRHLRVREDWVIEGDSWKVRVEKPSLEKFKGLFGEGASAVAADGLRVMPSTLRIHFLSTVQRAAIRIENNTETLARIKEIRLDEKFRLAEKLEEIKPRSKGSLVIEYTGKENEKELRSRVTLVLLHGDSEQSIEIPILYNHISDAERALMGLTEKEARALKRGERVKPAIQIPKTDQESGSAPFKKP